MKYRTFPDWMDWELENWARWSWQGKSPIPSAPTTCASFERHYRTPPWNEEEKLERPPTVFADRAMRIDALWQSLPDLYRRVLRNAYPQRRKFRSRAAEARDLGMKPEHYGDALNQAGWRMVELLNGKGR